MIIVAIISKRINLFKNSRKSTEQAILCNTTNEWNEIGANYVYSNIDSKTAYGGSIGVNDKRELVRTQYGYLKRTKDSEIHRLLRLSDYIPTKIKTNTQFEYIYGGSGGKQGMMIAGGPFILSAKKTVNVRTVVDARMHASTSWGWCWSGWGWKFTDVKFLDNHLPEYHSVLNTSDNGGTFVIGTPGYSWLSSENLPADCRCENNYRGALFNNHMTSGSNDYRKVYDETAKITIPAGKSFLCLYWSTAASGGDSAGYGYYGGDISIWV